MEQGPGLPEHGFAGVLQTKRHLADRGKAFLNRPIEGDWPYVKVRDQGRIVSRAVILAVGVNADGRREVLGLAVGPSEAAPIWTAFLRGLAPLRFEAHRRRERPGSNRLQSPQSQRGGKFTKSRARSNPPTTTDQVV